MNIIEEIQSLKNQFVELSKEQPNCVKLGKREVWQLTDWYNEISKPESDKKKIKINDGTTVMGLFVIKTNNRSFLEVGIEKNLPRNSWKMAVLNPNWKARVEVKNEESNKQAKE